MAEQPGRPLSRAVHRFPVAARPAVIADPESGGELQEVWLCEAGPDPPLRTSTHRARPSTAATPSTLARSPSSVAADLEPGAAAPAGDCADVPPASHHVTVMAQRRGMRRPRGGEDLEP
jgi:hypothetical protein